MSNQFKGAYLGFKYGDTHSSDLGIVRTSNGNRFDENLFPTIIDKALEIPGRDGKILQSAQYGPKNISVPFAFDAMTEQEYQQLKRVLGQKKIDKLVFDECPHKVRYAKIMGSNTFKHLAFEEKGVRIYKGEGTINFICYDPFAHCGADTDFVSLAREYPDFEELNLEYEKIKRTEGTNKITFTGCNYGDVPADFILYGVPNSTSQTTIKLNEVTKMMIDKFGTSGGYKVGLNSKIELIEGYNSSGRKTGEIYDDKILSGGYFKIPLGDFKLELSGAWTNVELKMDYLYF